MIEKESIIIRILKWLGIIKRIPVDKKAMCEQAQSICNHKCENCAWYERKEEWEK